MKSRLRFLLVISMMLPAPRFADAQVPTAGDSSRILVLRHAIDSNWHLRLTSARDTVGGRALAIEDETVRLVGSQFPLSGIERIERMRKHGGGAVVGGIVGGLGLGLIGAALSGLCDDGCDWIWAHAYITGAVVGGVTGAVIGNTVAPPRQRWDPIWP